MSTEYPLLFPADLREWLPENHLVHFISEGFKEIIYESIGDLYPHQQRLSIPQPADGFVVEKNSRLPCRGYPGSRRGYPRPGNGAEGITERGVSGSSFGPQLPV
jgi:hypothetical protein